MGFKDFIIVLLFIVIICGILFGSIGNFLGSISGVITGISDSVNSNEGYVYRGGLISDSISSSNTNSSGSALSSSGSAAYNSTSKSVYNSASNSVSGSSRSSSGGSESSSSSVVYEDYQRDYETGMVDEAGNPIYLSIVSSSGGQMDPGIYQVYWSALGPINQTKIG